MKEQELTTNEGQHFDAEEMQDILFAGKQPMMNSLPYNICYIDPKFKPDYLHGGGCMNIAFPVGKEPDVRKGDVVNWSNGTKTLTVMILDSTLLYVKGMRVRTYVVQIHSN